MGNNFQTNQKTELDSMKRYSGFSPGQIDIIRFIINQYQELLNKFKQKREKFDIMADEDLLMSKESFGKLMKINPVELERVKKKKIIRLKIIFFVSYLNSSIVSKLEKSILSNLCVA